jgi:hypothetical protein
MMPIESFPECSFKVSAQMEPEDSKPAKAPIGWVEDHADPKPAKAPTGSNLGDSISKPAKAPTGSKKRQKGGGSKRKLR